MSLRKQAARGVFWSAARNWGYQISSLVVFAVLSRLLTPEAFGLVALATLFIEFTKLITEQGMADALVQRKNLEPEHLDTAFWVSLGFGTGLTIIMASTSGLVANLVNEPDVAPILAWLSLRLAISGLSNVQMALLARELRFATLTLRTLSAVVVGGIVGVSAALAGAGVWSLVAQALTMEVVGVVALWTASDWRPRARFSRERFKELFVFGANVVGFRVLRFANRRVDNLMIGTFLGATALGFYVVGYRLLNLIINMTTSVIGSVAFPVFSKIQENRGRVRSAYYRSIRLTALASFPAFAGVIAIAPEATRLLFGNQWDASIPVMRVLALAGLVQSILFVDSTVIKSLGKPSWRVAIMGGTTVALVLAFAIAVQFGIVQVAIAMVVVTYATAPVWLYASNRLIGLRAGTYLRQVWAPMLSATVMAGVVFATKLLVADLSLLWRVAIAVAVGVATYGALLWITAKPAAKEAWELFRMSLPGRARRSRHPGVETPSDEL